MRGEFRQDLVSGHWVLIAPARARRPEPKKDETPVRQTSGACPFDNPQATGHGLPLLVFANGRELDPAGDLDGWTTQIIPNKFPALQAGVCGPARETGPFPIRDANGFHEIVITRDHQRSFAQFTPAQAAEVITAYRARYRHIAQDECGAYILIFHNHGPSAGATIAHNHSQIISTPILPPEVLESIRGSERYYAKHGAKVHDILIDWEMKERKRLIYENERFIAFCPFVSRTPYEMRIFPKTSNPYFERMPDDSIPYLADALTTVLAKAHGALGDPDYNFYIHTAPVATDESVSYDHYHWHVEIVPRVKIDAGFELATAISINQVDPDEAAALLCGYEHA